MERQRLPAEERLTNVVPESEASSGAKPLLEFLFPALSGTSSHEMDNPNALYHRRPLLTILRLGLIPGQYTKEFISRLFHLDRENVEVEIRKIYDEGKISGLIDRLKELYGTFPTHSDIPFWRGVGTFLKKEDCEWLTSYSPMHSIVRDFANLLSTTVRRYQNFRGGAEEIFVNLVAYGEDELTAHWLRENIFGHGLFGRPFRSDYNSFLSIEQTIEYARMMSRRWRGLHIAGELIPCRWDLQPLYTMIDVEVWDSECVAVLDEQLVRDDVVDGFTLMLYGAHFTTDKETVAKMCTYERYVGRVQERLSSGTMDETVRLALEKALKGGSW